MITVDDLFSNAKMRMVLALDMDRSQYQNTYRSETYPRLEVVKEGGPRASNGQQKHTTTYYVDNVEVCNLQAAVAMLNAEPQETKDDPQQG